MTGLLLIVSLLIIGFVVTRLVTGMRKSLYRYENITRLGMIIFISVFIVWDTVTFINDLKMGYPPSFFIMVMDIKTSVAIVMLYMFPVAFIVSLLVAASNVSLILKEGRNWRNMLGLILGGFVCLSTVLLVYGFYEIPYSEDFSYLIMDYLLYLYALFIAYLECILFGTVIMGIIAAKHIPHYDKDYLIVLGCRIREDGSLTPLLKSRVDKALEFAAVQEQKTGKVPEFVVSGGKGSDERISEAEAMKNYLLESGIRNERIIAETKSLNTAENIRFSTGLIKHENENAQIAFSTTNYHVFRAGNIAWEQGIDMEGIGARTRSYFWINAFIREFIATIIAEKKKHLAILGILALVLFIIQLYVY